MTFILSNRTYDITKRFVQVVLPAISALYFGLGQIWGFPETEKVVGSLAVITTFLGVCLGISHKTYVNSGEGIDGDMLVTEKEDGSRLASLELGKDPEILLNKDKVVFKVTKGPLPPK